VLDVGSQVHNVEGHVQNIRVEVRNSRALAVLGLFVSCLTPSFCQLIGPLLCRAASHLLVRKVSHVGSQVQHVRQLIHKLSPRDISDPVFFITDPVGRTVTIQLSYCDGFNVSYLYFYWILLYAIPGSRSDPQSSSTWSPSGGK
jgi:hypothetical protein